MITVTIIALFVVMVLAIIRAISGPSLFDRILAVNMFGTKTVLLISLLGFAMGRPDFLDIAMVYALINFISVIGILRFSDSTGFKDSNENKSVEDSQ